ncbi:hypothetical protein BDK51DRAFT_26663 [Blyttiomyces helicus]|uniref:Uncharacterized protein n=1 Tax=Blyttiomyces helicus TaxID=388810 RepID=A0A4V1IQN3_9FUNG|nr:hypothetical protein BDK51DRAFT_26663 [Blyttiomyces helicus]|eukprot:RKO87157.1 hypothetical protein BDK51DRAFT_26663 [Blyttiomyces helicus]
MAGTRGSIRMRALLLCLTVLLGRSEACCSVEAWPATLTWLMGLALVVDGALRPMPAVCVGGRAKMANACNNLVGAWGEDLFFSPKRRMRRTRRRREAAESLASYKSSPLFGPYNQGGAGGIVLLPELVKQEKVKGKENEKEMNQKMRRISSQNRLLTNFRSGKYGRKGAGKSQESGWGKGENQRKKERTLKTNFLEEGDSEGEDSGKDQRRVCVGEGDGTKSMMEWKWSPSARSDRNRGLREGNSDEKGMREWGGTESATTLS